MSETETVARADLSISKQLVDKLYEKRKAAALELEKCVSSSSGTRHEVTAYPPGRYETATSKMISDGYLKLSTSSWICSATRLIRCKLGTVASSVLRERPSLSEWT